MTANSTYWEAKLRSDYPVFVEIGKTLVLISIRIIALAQKDDLRRYPLIIPIQAPFLCSGSLFDTNSGKTSTIIL